MNPDPLPRFVTAGDVIAEASPWGVREPLCRPGLTGADRLYMVRMTMPPGYAHPFHRHPGTEEIIYVISGTAEQWVDRESRLLGAGELAYIPADTVHGTYNPGAGTLVFIAILSAATAEPPSTVDVSTAEPWRSLRADTAGA